MTMHTSPIRADRQADDHQPAIAPREASPTAMPHTRKLDCSEAPPAPRTRTSPARPAGGQGR